MTLSPVLTRATIDFDDEICQLRDGKRFPSTRDINYFRVEETLLVEGRDEGSHNSISHVRGGDKIFVRYDQVCI